MSKQRHNKAHQAHTRSHNVPDGANINGQGRPFLSAQGRLERFAESGSLYATMPKLVVGTAQLVVGTGTIRMKIIALQPANQCPVTMHLTEQT